jgi:hypothetical protein
VAGLSTLFDKPNWLSLTNVGLYHSDYGMTSQYIPDLEEYRLIVLDNNGVEQTQSGIIRMSEIVIKP